ncbi:hypothetical protein FSARC_12600 [Fusarium sarcochroum]|uniref:Amine oxidase n=1 Tax=Fusarium sarcochroum TaxID=1208366 RepID=A0A8H4WVT3_9HYPO|nr:hypothetical protein FSARC_12600 [Fusarium sarcochroum]
MPLSPDQDSGCCAARSTADPGRDQSAVRPHPLDPLSPEELLAAAALVRAASLDGVVKFNSITLLEPPKGVYTAFRDSRSRRPERRALAVVISRKTHQISEVTVNLVLHRVEAWRDLKDVMPILTLEDLDVIERIARKSPAVIEACKEIGITDMSKVFFDGWAIGYDQRWGFERRLQQALPYYREYPSDNQYAHPLDFNVIADTEREEILAVDIRTVNGERTPFPRAQHNYLPEFISHGYRNDLKPINITQPEGVSFHMSGNEIEWAGLKMHIGFNYREGVVLSDVRIRDPKHQDQERMVFGRLSVVEMFVPYGCPKEPHHRKHAFDIGEYGSGYMANSLKLGCDCKGTIHYLDANMVTGDGKLMVIENAICIHEEDHGLLYKHTDFRDGRVISARDRKLIISQVLTAANYEYAFYHTFTLDGTYKLEVKLTGLLNTYCLHPTESAEPYGTKIASGIDAQNHQHIFSLRVDPEIDGPCNSVIQSDAVQSDAPAGSEANPHGNGFFAKKTVFRTSLEGAASYCHETSRTWDIVNPNRINEATDKFVGYKIINTSCPELLAKDNSIIAKRGAFTKKALWVLPYADDQRFPAGSYVCQSTGDAHPENETITEWVGRNGAIENTDIVCYIQFGLTHFPRAEDFPIMPAEPVSVILRASNFFERNPALWVPPSTGTGDQTSQLAYPQRVAELEAPITHPKI